MELERKRKAPRKAARALEVEGRGSRRGMSRRRRLLLGGVRRGRAGGRETHGDLEGVVDEPLESGCAVGGESQSVSG